MIESVFDVGGSLEREHPGYRPRPGQVAMAKLIEKALKEERHAIIEGPTGLGKSYAYLVPTIQHAIKNRKKVIVVTGNIGLQEQLVSKDLPALEAVLRNGFSFALAKGRNNYLCRRVVEKTLTERGIVDTKQLPLLKREEPELGAILDWAFSTLTGDVSELPDTPPPALWRQLSVGSDECTGNACKQRAQCFSEKAKRSVASADVVVTNYHLFFAHLVVRAAMRKAQEDGTGGAEVDIVLPPVDVVVFDECHKAADIARDFLGFSVTKSACERLLNGVNDPAAQRGQAATEALFDALARHRKSRDYRARLRGRHGLETVGQRFAEAFSAMGNLYTKGIGGFAWDADQVAELRQRAQRAFTLAENVRQALVKPDPDVVYFLEEGFRETVVLKSKPITVSKFLENELFEEYTSVISTSATIASTTGKDAFTFYKREIGALNANAYELIGESPFTFGKNVMIVVPKTMADAKDRDAFPASAATHFRRVVEAARGRTLGLFTSYKVLGLAHEQAKQSGFPILKQGESSLRNLVQKFREDVSSVLLGSESCWAGVDVPGESLSCVVIDRLPFPNPDDAVFDAISERDSRAFFTYAVPKAVIQFKQGFGRLIRTETDRGVVVVLDRRIVESNYGQSFLRALPKTRMGDEVEDVAAFLGAAS